jgi:hypothetical protein
MGSPFACPSANRRITGGGKALTIGKAGAVWDLQGTMYDFSKYDLRIMIKPA